MKKEIFLKSLSILNFKGVRSFSIEFTNKETVILGDNGTGKTTIMDAFLWLLFGKDSTNRADSNFNIKTLDADGKPILNMEHEVSATLVVNGNEVTLKRCYLEKWGVGSNVGQLKGHYTEFFINDVKQGTKKEFDAEVSDIIPEDVFRMVTNPLYFPSLAPDTQKTILLDIVGHVSDDDVAAIKPEFIELLGLLNGRTLAKFKQEISSKKTAIKDEINGIPARIDEVNRAMPDAENWKELEKELAEKAKSAQEIDNQIADKSKLITADYERKSKLQKEIGEKKLERSRVESSIHKSIDERSNSANASVREIEHKIQQMVSANSHSKSQADEYHKQTDSLKKEMADLRTKYGDVNSEQLQYPEGVFECPTCKRPLEAEDITAKQAELLANFNLDKSKRLQDIQTSGKAKNKEAEGLQTKRDELLKKLEDNNSQIESLQIEKQELTKELPAEQDTKATIVADDNWIKLGNEISELENQLKVDTSTPDDLDLKDGKRVITECIDELKKQLSKREIIERSHKRIEELEDIKAKNNQALTDLERLEFIALEFQKTKDNELLNRINGLFSLVSFSFVSEMLNGNDKLTCVCTVNGTPYPDVNHAAKINAGLDIINALCQSKEITAPIFIDNRESVNSLLNTASQVINLSVSDHKKLVVKTGESEFVEL